MDSEGWCLDGLSHALLQDLSYRSENKEVSFIHINEHGRIQGSGPPPIVGPRCRPKIGPLLDPPFLFCLDVDPPPLPPPPPAPPAASPPHQKASMLDGIAVNPHG